MPLEARKSSLTTALTEPLLPELHPQIAEVFRQKATTLAAGLEHDEQRDAARLALRGFLDKNPGETMQTIYLDGNEWKHTTTPATLINAIG